MLHLLSICKNNYSDSYFLLLLSCSCFFHCLYTGYNITGSIYSFCHFDNYNIRIICINDIFCINKIVSPNDNCLMKTFFKIIYNKRIKIAVSNDQKTCLIVYRIICKKSMSLIRRLRHKFLICKYRLCIFNFKIFNIVNFMNSSK